MDDDTEDDVIFDDDDDSFEDTNWDASGDICVPYESEQQIVPPLVGATTLQQNT